MDFEREVAKHKDAVYRQMVRVCGNADDAEDALVEAMVSAFRYSDQLKDSSSFRAWLASIGRRACYKMRQKGQEEMFASLEALQEAGMPMPTSGDLTADEEAEMQETHQCVLAAISTLPDTYKEVYVMREIDGTSANDTAKKLGLSVPAVKSRLHRARTLVREALDNALCAP